MFSQEKPCIVHDHSVYAAINQCKATDLEKLYIVDRISQNQCLYVYKDFIGRYRAVLCINDAGVSGVLVGKSGMIEHKETAPEHRGKAYTRSICALLSMHGIYWMPSIWQTTAGAACYKQNPAY